jgi:predicted flap endonuclease-1-like 5' DNA nuclease
MGQGPSRGGHSSSDKYEDRQRDVDVDEAQEDVDAAIERVRERFENANIDEEDVGRVAGGALDGFAGGAVGGLAGSATGNALGREAGGRAASQYAARQLDDRPSSINDIDGIGEGKAEALREAGYETLDDLRGASREALESVSGIGPATARKLKQAGEMAASGVESVSPSVAENIRNTPFEPQDDGATPQARQVIGQATAEVKKLYRSTAAAVASRARIQQVAEDMTAHVEEGVFDSKREPYFEPTAVGANDTGRISLSPGTTADDVSHELGHAMCDAYGYARGRASLRAEDEYKNRLDRGESDPFITSDPTNTGFHMTQDNGQRVDNVPDEFAALMEETNQAWQRIQRAHQNGGIAAAENYTIRNNYSATSASEVFAQLNEVAQSDNPQMDRKNVRNQESLVMAYAQVFSLSGLFEEILGLD